MDKVLFSKKSDNWGTPDDLKRELGVEDFFDPCPLDWKVDGLSIEWTDFNFVNPPYSDIMSWAKKALEEAKKGRRTVFLVPARTDTEWFHMLFYEYNCPYKFIRGRLKFKGGRYSAPFPSMVFWIG